MDADRATVKKAGRRVRATTQSLSANTVGASKKDARAADELVPIPTSDEPRVRPVASHCTHWWLRILTFARSPIRDRWSRFMRFECTGRQAIGESAFCSIPRRQLLKGATPGVVHRN